MGEALDDGRPGVALGLGLLASGAHLARAVDGRGAPLVPERTLIGVQIQLDLEVSEPRVQPRELLGAGMLTPRPVPIRLVGPGESGDRDAAAESKGSDGRDENRSRSHVIPRCEYAAFSLSTRSSLPNIPSGV